MNSTVKHSCCAELLWWVSS